MKIVGLTASNVKKLTAIELRPGDKNLLEITGRNGQGKSSVIDSIWYALGGGDKLPDEPIKHGADEASIEIDLGDLVVIRRITKHNTVLTVKNKEGAKYPKPQQILDAFVGRLTFDPLTFLRLKASEQRQELLKLVGMGDRLDRLQSEDEEDQAARALLNRDLKRFEASLAQSLQTSGEPENGLEKVDVEQLMEEIELIDRENQKAIQLDQDAESNRREQESSRKRLAEQKQANLETIERLQKLDAELDTRIAVIDQQLELPKAENPKRSTAELRQKLAGSTRQNQKVAYAAEIKKLRDDIQKVQDKVSDANFKLRERQALREKMVAEASWPLPDLTVDFQNVRYRDVPLDQASTAEQLRVSCALAMAMNPKLKVLLLRDGSLLDQDNLRVIQELAQDKDYQVWVERVESGMGEPLVVLEDGLAK